MIVLWTQRAAELATFRKTQLKIAMNGQLSSHVSQQVKCLDVTVKGSVWRSGRVRRSCVLQLDGQLHRLQRRQGKSRSIGTKEERRAQRQRSNVGALDKRREQQRTTTHLVVSHANLSSDKVVAARIFQRHVKGDLCHQNAIAPRWAALHEEISGLVDLLRVGVARLKPHRQLVKAFRQVGRLIVKLPPLLPVEIMMEKGGGGWMR